LEVEKMTKQFLDVVYENGVFRPLEPLKEELREGEHVRLVLVPEADSNAALDTLNEVTHIYDGLSDEEIDEFEKIALDRSNFFGERDGRKR
jgi:predicted DNA-binding antitoxin AbrB/MazE fold protein